VVTVGQDPDVAAKLGDVLVAFGDPAPVVDLAVGVRRLRALLSGARCLIVLDDVWDVDVLRAFPVPADVRVLVTTRTREALFADSPVHNLATADDETSRRVLASYAGCTVDALPAAADPIARRCGGLVLALALVGSMVRLGRRWEHVAERLRRADLEKLAAQFEDRYPYPTCSPRWMCR
jgi:hypothetical protein